MTLSKETLLQAFTKAIQDYNRSNLQMFQRDADMYAVQLINQYNVDPEFLDDIYFGTNA